MFLLKRFKELKSLVLLLVGIMILPLAGVASDHIILAARENSPINTISVLVLEKAYRRIGMKVQVEYLPGNQSIVMANKGLLDGEVSRLRFVLNKYRNLRLVPVPILYGELVAITRDPAIKINGWESLSSYRVVAQGSFRLVWDKIYTHPKAYRVPDATTALKNLLQGDADIAILNRYEGERLIEVFGYRDIIVILPPLESHPIYHLLHMKNEHLIPRLSKALKKMRDDGTLKKIWDLKGAKSDSHLKKIK